jgi:hypothetical protein
MTDRKDAAGSRENKKTEERILRREALKKISRGTISMGMFFLLPMTDRSGEGPSGSRPLDENNAYAYYSYYSSYSYSSTRYSSYYTSNYYSISYYYSTYSIPKYSSYGTPGSPGATCFIDSLKDGKK